MDHNVRILIIILVLIWTLTGLQIANSQTPIPTITANYQWTTQFQSFGGVDMALVPPGCFMMGSTEMQVSDLNIRTTGWSFDNEKPQSQVCFDQPFWIDKTEVTQQQFTQFGGTAAYLSYWRGANQPVDDITWFEARDFCAKREARLPSEAEWEYSARGPDDLIYPWGNNFDGNKVIWNRPFLSGTVNVGSAPEGASWVGAMDLSGNAGEWTHSLYFAYPYNDRDGRESNLNTDGLRVQRGATYSESSTNLLRSAFRNGVDPSTFYSTIGFRCAHSYDAVATNAPESAGTIAALQATITSLQNAKTPTAQPPAAAHTAVLPMAGASVLTSVPTIPAQPTSVPTV